MWEARRRTHVCQLSTLLPGACALHLNRARETVRRMPCSLQVATTPMLLWKSSGEGGEVGAKGDVDLPGNVTLEAAQDFLAGQAFGSAPGGVGAGAGVVAQSAQGDGVQGMVGVAVT